MKEPEFTFRTTLREVKDFSKPPDALLEDPEFQRRGKMICLGLAPNRPIAEDLFQIVGLKVWLKVRDHFDPDYTKPYGNFFAWYRRIARNSFFSMLPEMNLPIDDVPVEEHLTIADPNPNPEELVERRERADQIRNHVKTCSRKIRLATTLFLKGRSSRRSEAILNRLGIKCCHVTVLKWVRAGLQPFFPDGDVSPIKRAVGY